MTNQIPIKEKMNVHCGCGWAAPIVGDPIPGTPYLKYTIKEVLTLSVEHARNYRHVVQIHGEIRPEKIASKKPARMERTEVFPRPMGAA